MFCKAKSTILFNIYIYILDILFFIKNRYSNIKIGFWANIWIYSDFWEFTNEYLNIFGCPKIYEWISEYIRTREMARIRIRIIFEGHFVRIFEYSNICAHHWGIWSIVLLEVTNLILAVSPLLTSLTTALI